MATIARPLALALALASVAAVTLTGCTAVQDAVHREASHEFADTADVRDHWDRTAPWLPDDATEIVTHETTDGDIASLIAASAQDLDPATCAETERRSAPTFPLPGAPDVYTLDSVYACGAWAVVRTDDGWFGWTPSNPGEQEQSPSS